MWHLLRVTLSEHASKLHNHLPHPKQLKEGRRGMIHNVAPKMPSLQRFTPWSFIVYAIPVDRDLSGARMRGRTTTHKDTSRKGSKTGVLKGLCRRFWRRVLSRCLAVGF